MANSASSSASLRLVDWETSGEEEPKGDMLRGKVGVACILLGGCGAELRVGVMVERGMEGWMDEFYVSGYC